LSVPTSTFSPQRRRLVASVGGVAVCAAWAEVAGARNSAAAAAKLRIVRAAPAEPLTYDLRALEALGLSSIATAVPWDAQPRHWEGVSLKRLLVHAQAQGRPTLVKALNDYSARLPWSDMEQYDPILAWRRDGQPIAVRDKGPLLVIYPFQRFPQIEGHVHTGRSVWHVTEIVVE
jgi:hypothetical protein